MKPLLAAAVPIFGVAHRNYISATARRISIRQFMKRIATAIFILSAVSPILAKTSHSGGGHTTGFATGHCKAAKCSAKHPSGSYIHPITSRKH
jgi:hypothetical protein